MSESQESTSVLPGNISLEVLYKLARAYRNFRNFHGMGTTSLAHDAYLKVAENRQVVRLPLPWWKSVLESVAVSRIRKKMAACRWGGDPGNSLLTDLANDRRENYRQSDYPMDHLLLLDNAITSAERVCPELAQLLRMRFHGLTYDEIAAKLQVSKTTAKSRVSLALHWLRGWLDVSDDGSGE